MQQNQARDFASILVDTLAPKDFVGTLDDLNKVTKAANDIRKQLEDNGYFKILEEVGGKEIEILAPVNKHIQEINEKIIVADEKTKESLEKDRQLYVGVMNNKYVPQIEENNKPLVEANKQEIDILLSDEKFECAKKFFEDKGKDIVANVQALIALKDIIDGAVEYDELAEKSKK